jgi:5-methylthioadenosine/S-adenosylhomocysteine deaminase
LWGDLLSLMRQRPCSIHVAESRSELDFFRDGSGEIGLRARNSGHLWQPPGITPVRYLEELGVLASRPILVHCVHIKDADIASLARTGCSVVHSPRSNLWFGHGIAPVAKLLEQGVTVGLGSDSVVSNNAMDLLAEAHTCNLLQRLHGHVLNSATLLSMATLEGARALGLADEVGSLVPGRKADIIAVDLTPPRTIPVHCPETNLVASAVGSNVIMTMVEGEVLYQKGQNEPPLWSKCRQAIELVAQRLRLSS